MGNYHKYFVTPEVDRIKLGDDEWVDIKRRMSVADQDTLSQRLFEIEVDQNMTRAERRRRRSDGASALKQRFRPSTVEVLAVAIVDWSFTDDDGNKVPVSHEMIGRLDPEIAMHLEDEIELRNPLTRSQSSHSTTPIASKGGVSS